MQVGACNNQRAKKALLEPFTGGQLTGNSKFFTDKMSSVDNKFDYVVFLAHAFNKQVSFDLADVVYDDKFAMLSHNLESIEVLKNKLVAQKEKSYSEKSDRVGLEGSPTGMLQNRIKNSDQRGRVGNIKAENEMAVYQFDRNTEELNTKIPSKKDTYYDTWQDTNWKEAPPSIASEDRPDVNQEDAEFGQNDPRRHFYLAISVVKAEGLVFSTMRDTPNCMFKASFVLKCPDSGKEVARHYTSDVAPRQSNPEWNFQMNYQFTDLRAFYEENKDVEIVIELVHLHPVTVEGQTYTEERYLTSLSGKIFAEFTEDDISQLDLQHVTEISKRVILTDQDGVKVHLEIELLSNPETMDNPFREGLMDDGANEDERGIL